MQTSAIDVNTMINGSTLFDQAVSAPAANMKATFDMQIAGISQTFAATFQAIDATIATGAANRSIFLDNAVSMLTKRLGADLALVEQASVLRSAIKLFKDPVLCHRGHHDLAMLRTFWQKDRLDHFQQDDVFLSLCIDVLDPDVPWAKGGVRGSRSKCTAFFNDIPVEHLTI